ncbi:3-phosphoshikimate 1-carboxyvinyltransferase [Candidatus Pantoea carbekii]|uniref:3-phosphoshikimate 1-carboxyvinyltransferase n=1 Tax=Candidatus Pantoea carbekii TaxID=1235990 RepID=U3U6U3_9GAMM|nr:3-phosphoshikimate 1-carboxyvinyltransferase [Candidatus Pantoea carbekii]AKC32163.1 3-phosphoshikimater 1carboxyvinyltransferase AroA [Candidatus Pantoea carbekii]BAO00690.1 AroA protein [Candidatus Pantoea carbekii]
MQDSLILEPIAHIDGTINLPGSKSISNRALLLSALASGTTQLTNLLNSDDVKYMLHALKAMKINYTLSHDNTICKIVGNSGPLQSISLSELFLGNAGTAMRPLVAIFSLGQQSVILTGEPRMHDRPIHHLVDALRQGGAKIDYLAHRGYPPLHLYGGFIGGQISIDGSISSQFLTALLMCAPLAQKDTIITIKGNLVSKPYIDMTLYLMRSFNVKVENQNYQRFIVKGQQQYRSPGHFLIEGDASSASYFLAAAAIKGGTVRVTGIGYNSIQGDVLFADVLEEMGAIIERSNHDIICTRNKLKSINMDMNHMPDAAMTIATTALFAQGTTLIRNIHNWRVKETDRLLAMSTELRKVGAEVEEGSDFIRITPPVQFHRAHIKTYNDHRIAMCFSLVALSNMPVTILDPSCTKKTFPDYFKKFKSISQYI